MLWLLLCCLKMIPWYWGITKPVKRKKFRNKKAINKIICKGATKNQQLFLTEKWVNGTLSVKKSEICSFENITIGTKSSKSVDLYNFFSTLGSSKVISKLCYLANVDWVRIEPTLLLLAVYNFYTTIYHEKYLQSYLSQLGT